jgi:hypothetical protein
LCFRQGTAWKYTALQSILMHSKLEKSAIIRLNCAGAAGDGREAARS